MDKIETVIASKRIARWSGNWKADIVQLTPTEREVLMTLVALLDARPVEADVPSPSRVRELQNQDLSNVPS